MPNYNPAIVGVGSVTATLAGNKLTIAGTFEGLACPATTARIHKGTKTGVRGEPMLNLTITSGTSGSISGAFDLTPAQVQGASPRGGARSGSEREGARGQPVGMAAGAGE